MPPKDFKVVIAGGSIAGLTLANMLEKLGIDFVVLEAYPEIAPQIGASIGLLPNGLRVLDQLGLYPAIRGLVEGPLTRAFSREPLGTVFREIEDVGDIIRHRHGYDIIFIDRRLVIEKLYNHLKDKQRILTNKKVTSVKHEGSKVKVITSDGSEFVGDILVGADGVHSTVRQEMWKIANQMKPGYIPASEHTALESNTTYKCIFGISVMKGFQEFTSNSTWHKQSPVLVVAGPENKFYWFLFQNVSKELHEKGLPKYTKEEEEMLAHEHWNDKVTQSFTFGDLYSARVISVLTPLPTYVFKKWHFGRIMTIGDAAHKLEPISGQGGNSAIETAAVLVNNIVLGMKSHPEGLSEVDIDEIFSNTQRLRSPRVQALAKTSQKQQEFEALETPLLEFFARYCVPYLSLNSLLAPREKDIEGGHLLNMLSTPKIPHYVPYEDELAAKTFKSSYFVKAIVASLLLLIFRAAQSALAVDAGLFNLTYIGHELKKTYSGISDIDSMLSVLVWAFSQGVSGEDGNQRLQCIYFIFVLTPLVLIWTVEGYRKGNQASLVSIPVLFGIYQLVGIGRVAPIYYLFSLYSSSNILYTRTIGRAIPSSVAKSLLPALCIGYILPTILMFLPYEDVNTQQNYVAFWQLFPIYVAVLTFGLSSLISRLDGKTFLDELYMLKDVMPLQITYGVAFVVAAATHVASIIYIFSNASLSVAETYFNLPPPSGVNSSQNVIFAFFKYDMILCFASAFVWCLYSIFELRRTGYIKTGQAIRAAVATIAAQVVVGPGAAYGGVWAWRERIIVKQTPIGHGESDAGGHSKVA